MANSPFNAGRLDGNNLIVVSFQDLLGLEDSSLDPGDRRKQPLGGEEPDPHLPLEHHLVESHGCNGPVEPEKETLEKIAGYPPPLFFYDI